jgi:hypothetical protein
MPTNPPHPLAALNPGLLAPAASGRPPATAELLLGANLPALSFLVLADRLAALYAMVFPDRPDWLDAETVDWTADEQVAAALERFLRRVSRLFPVHDEIWDLDLETIEWRLQEIPIAPLGYDLWYDEWQDFKEPAPYLLHMCHSRQEEAGQARRSEFARLYPQHRTPRSLAPHLLVDSLRQMAAEQSLPEPLDALPDLIEMLEESCGNFWLDVGELSLAEGGGYPVWSAEEVAWLAAEWRRAGPIMDRVQRLLDWQNETPEQIDRKLTAVRDALLAAQERKDHDEPTDATVTVAANAAAPP